MLSTVAIVTLNTHLTCVTMIVLETVRGLIADFVNACVCAMAIAVW